jgi:hypothetical protein
MRKPLYLTAVALGLCGFAWLSLRADTQHIEVTVTTSAADVRVAISEGTAAVSPTRTSRDFSLLMDAGKPALPVRTVRVLVPGGLSVAGVEASASGAVELAVDVDVKRADGPKATPDAGVPAALVPPPVVAPDDGGAAFPSEFVRYLGSGTWHGYTIASFAVFPVRVEGSRVVLYENVSLRVATRAVTDAVPAARARRATARTVAGIEDAIRKTVVNPEAASGYARITPRKQSGPFLPTGVPSLEGSPVEYVIITTAALAAQFDSLAIWKTAKGVPTVVKTVEWIEANYRRGTDRAETVRTFIQDAYEKWGVQWVLIGGDTPEIPPRYFYSAYYYGGASIPCDLYFAGLDGDFNADHDTRFGEQPVDSPDLYPEVYVGRLPVSSTTAAHTVLRKIRRYETPVKPAYTDKVLFLAEVLFPAPWDPPQTILQNGGDIAEYVSAIYVASPSRRVTRCLETEWYYPGSVHETRLIAIDSLNAGYNQVFHVGHGYRFNMHCGDDNIAIPDADALDHPDEFFNLYFLNCTASAFDYDCLAEHMLRNPNGGAVSVVGATGSAFADVSAFYMEDYADQVYTQGENHIGAAFALGRANRTSYAALGDNADLWTHYVYTLLSDPELPMWTAAPKTPAVTHAASVPAGINTITVTVQVDGSPKSNASVCLWKSAEDYQVLPTNVAGQAAFTFSTPTAGSIRVVATARDIKRYEGTIAVSAAAGAMPVVESLTVDDDNLGGTVGNGDGVIDAGETIDLTPAVRNKGGAAAPSLTGTLTSINSGVTVTDATCSVPSSAPGVLVSAADAWRIQVGASVTDEYTANFTAVLLNGGSSWVSQFARLVHAPALEVTALRRSDEIPVGDGNGVIASGEQFLLFATLKNFGTGRADGLGAVLSALDAGSTVIDSLASFANLGHLASGENTVGFKLSEANVSIANLLRVVVTDSHGRTLTHDFELREPAAPTLQTFNASLGVDKMGLTWSPGGSSDVLGYNVYRSTAAGGPFVRANSDVILHTLFTDTGLSPSTRYYYKVATVDQSGNEGPQSPAASASTNPPQLTGWPNELVDPSACSPVVADVDGYGAMEVVVGNDRMYAWHADGQEVIDGDQAGITWGVISPLGDDFVGPAALAELDGTPGYEIAAAAYTSKQVFCFQGDGSVMAGWPRATVDLVRAGVTVGDIDGDGQPEIIAVDQDAYLYAWHKNGTEVIDGDANPLTNGVFKRLPDTSQWQYQMAALADIDGDGKEEIIVPTQDAKLYVFNETGGNEPNWPFSLPNYAGGGVAIGDVDNNGDLELVVTTRNTGETYCLNHNATVMWQTWINTNLFFNPSPALADLTGDGKLEAIVPASNGRLYAIQYNGAAAPGWPIYYSTTTYTEASPVIADVNGDGSVDVLLGDEGRFINAWNSTGVPLEGFPLVMKDAVRSTPTVTDMNKDGLVDIVAVGYDKTVYAWALSAPYDATKAPWPTYRGNVLHNGLYGVTIPTGTGDQPARAWTTRLLQNTPNPFNPSTRIAYEIEEGAPARVNLTIYDVTGARVRTLVDEVERPGEHFVLWDGRNAAGDAVGSGVYFYRLATPNRALTRKMVLLK